MSTGGGLTPRRANSRRGKATKDAFDDIDKGEEEEMPEAQLEYCDALQSGTSLSPEQISQATDLSHTPMGKSRDNEEGGRRFADAVTQASDISSKHVVALKRLVATKNAEVLGLAEQVACLQNIGDKDTRKIIELRDELMEARQNVYSSAKTMVDSVAATARLNK